MKAAIARGLVAAALASIAVFMVAAPGHAQEESTVASVALDQRIPTQGRTTPDTVHVVSTAAVPAAFVGGTCDVVVTGANNGSVHPGSDILVTSANLVTISDVEREAGAMNIPADRPLELGESVSVAVRLGADGVFSGGTLVVDFGCTPPPPPPTTTTTAPPCTEDMPCWNCSTMGNLTCATTPPTVPPAGTPPATLPHTGAELWIGIVGGILLVSGIVGIAVGKSIKAMDR